MDKSYKAFFAYGLFLIGLIVIMNLPARKPVEPVKPLKPGPCETIHVMAEKYGIPETLMVALVNQETPDWNVDDISKNANGSIDMGLWKFNSLCLTWFRAKFGLIDPFDYANATESAARYLVWLKNRTGSWEGAVAAWNCGLTRYKTGSIPITTQRHVNAIMTEARLTEVIK